MRRAWGKLTLVAGCREAAFLNSKPTNGHWSVRDDEQISGNDGSDDGTTLRVCTLCH